MGSTDSVTDESRKKILDSLYQGELTISDAKAQAAARGVELEVIPDATNFNPFKQRRWSLLMTLAWIIWRTPDQVRKQWNDYRSGWLILRARKVRNDDGNGARTLIALEQIGDAHIDRLSIEYDIERQRRPAATDLASAQGQLWEALRNGELSADALDVDGSPCTVPGVSWKSLTFNGKRNDWPDGVSGGNKSYHEVELLSAEVKALWPPAVSGEARSHSAEDLDRVPVGNIKLLTLAPATLEKFLASRGKGGGQRMALRDAKIHFPRHEIPRDELFRPIFVKLFGNKRGRPSAEDA